MSRIIKNGLVATLLLILGVAAGYVINYEARRSGEPEISVIAAEVLQAAGLSGMTELILIADSNCPIYDQAKRFLEAHEIDFVELDVTRSDQIDTLSELIDLRVNPTIIIGKQMISGFKPEQLLRLWREHSSAQGIAANSIP